MAPKFGTSGLRGLVTELTADCIHDHIAAFTASCDCGQAIYVGHDLRDSSPQIADMVAAAATGQGMDVVMCGAVPTPALALAAMGAGAGAVMITGSHIPADRNGLKFYTVQGEITKEHEQAIVAALGAAHPSAGPGQISARDDVGPNYAVRYASAFGRTLVGQRIGLYAHSAVGRDLMAELMTDLGAEVIPLGRSDIFIPVDTEAVAADIRGQLRDWADAHGLDAIVSTDADGDRPLVTDQTGEVIPGDILGQITAAFVKAQSVVTPISSNTGLEASGRYPEIVRTKIGSPFVIAGMEQSQRNVVGYEANGGFLLGFDARGPQGNLPGLLTRDALLPMLACLSAANGQAMSELVAQQPTRFTAADRLQEVDMKASQALIAGLSGDADQRAAFLRHFDGAEEGLTTLDGLRMTLTDGRIVHLRPSGNAPELRLYVEAEAKDMAQDMLAKGLDLLRQSLTGG